MDRMTKEGVTEKEIPGFISKGNRQHPVAVWRKREEG